MARQFSPQCLAKQRNNFQLAVKKQKYEIKYCTWYNDVIKMYTYQCRDSIPP